MKVRVEQLDPDRHDRSGFDSGNPTLDEWLRRFAHQNDARHNTGRTWVVLNVDHPTQIPELTPILAYVTIAAHGVGVDVGAALPIRGPMPDPIPAALIARLAVAREEQGSGLGGRVLRFAVERIVVANQSMAVTLVVADAIDESAVSFYEHHGFARVPGTNRLIARTSDLAAALRAGRNPS